MQGRLSAMVDGKIQAFPWNEWREEFPRASALGLTRIEWTIDQDRLRENPLNTAAGQQEILELSRRHALRPASLTGDCFMQAPFWKTEGETQKSLVDDLDLVLASCSILGIEFVVMPLVDNGRIESTAQAETLLRVLLDRAASLSKQGVKIVFESDLPPAPLAQFIDKFPREVFGINYDSGNSAALGYDSAEEIPAYAPAHSQCACEGPAAWRHHRAARNGRGGSRQDHPPHRAVRLSRTVYTANGARHRRRSRRRAGTIS
jgi:hexulose-6-phosphate isomerase